MTTSHGVLRSVPLGDLRLDHRYWTNPRSFTGLGAEEISELGKDIKHRGIQVPLVVQRIIANGDEFPLVLDGQRRVLAARDALPKTTLIPVIDRTPEPIELTAELAGDLMLDMLAIGQQREGLSSFELSEVAEKLRSQDYTMHDIGKAVGRHESWVSKILKARAAAQPKLLLRWRKGEITDEQFKDLAEIPAEDQAKEARAIVEAREAGDVAEARVRAKEAKETTRKAAGKAKPEPKVTLAVKGPQADLFGDKPERPARDPHKKTPPTKLVLEEMVGLADKRPPTHDYVKGLMDGVRYALGDLGPEKFGKAWTAYLARIDGSGRRKAKKPAPRKTGGKAREGKNAKTAKPAKRKGKR